MRLRSSMPMWCACLSAARHLCYRNDPPTPTLLPLRTCLCRFSPQVWLARGSCAARHSGPLNRPGIVSERGPAICMEREERFTSPSAGPPGASEQGGGEGGWGEGVVLEQPPCRRNQVLSVPLQTPPSISPVPFPLPGPPSGGRGDASAPMTSSRDKRRAARHKYCQRLADVRRTC